MHRTLITFSAVAALVTGAAFCPDAGAQNRAAEVIVTHIESIEMPGFDASKRDDPEYRKEYFEKRKAALQKQADLILELFQTHPNHQETLKRMPERWSLMTATFRDTDRVRLEAGQYLEDHPKGPLAQEAKYALAQVELRDLWTVEPDQKPAMIERVRTYARTYPKDDRSVGLLGTLAQYHIEDDTEAKQTWEYLLANYPDHRSAKYWPGKIRQYTGIGQPFNLEFTDAMTGTDVSMEELQGKVVVIDFWATWCGPCVGEMPHMKELYAHYKDKGVEFIGVSLDNPVDQGGLTKLREFCEKNEINWPQYYLGHGWSSEFSISWGINSIPTMFIIDRHGDLYATDARERLDTLIPELLGHRAGVDR